MRAFDYPSGYAGNTHQHRLHQVVYPIRGLVTVETPEHHVTVAPYRAYAIESWTSHRVAAVGNTSMRSVFIDPDADLQVPSAAAFNVRPLLHELIREAGNQFGEAPAGSTRDQILNLIESLLFTEPIHSGFVALPNVTHPRLVRAFEGLLDAEPFPTLKEADCAAAAALSPRQFRRLFRTHVGMSFKDWRSLARVRKAAQEIAEGQSISQVATHLSLSSASALGVIFKRHTGLTPAQFARMQLADA